MDTKQKIIKGICLSKQQTHVEDFTSLPDVYPITSCLYNTYISFNDKRLEYSLNFSYNLAVSYK